MQTYEEAVSFAAAEKLKAGKLFLADGSEMTLDQFIKTALRAPWYIKAAFWIMEAWSDIRVRLANHNSTTAEDNRSL